MEAEPIDSVDTACGRVSACRLAATRCNYDLQALLRTIADYDQVMEYLGSEGGPRDALARLYCMAGTVLHGASTVVPPADGDLRSLLVELRTDLNDAMTFLQTCIDLVVPLEQLPA